MTLLTSVEYLYLSMIGGLLLVLLTTTIFRRRKPSPQKSGLTYRVGKIKLNKNDVLVVKCQQHIADDTAEWIRADIARWLGRDVPVIVLDKGFDLSKIERK